MAIGCVFTLAGYFLATLSAGGFNPQNTSAQNNTKQVIDEIVCRKLRVINPDGKTVAILADDAGGVLYIYNKRGKKVLDVNSIFGGGELGIFNGAGKRVIVINTLFDDGGMAIFNGAGKRAFSVYSDEEVGGELGIYNKDDTEVFAVRVTHEGNHTLLLKGKHEKEINRGKIRLYPEGLLVFNKQGTNVLQVGVDNKDGGILETSDKLGNRTGRLPR